MANVLCIYENKIATVASLEKFFHELAKYDSRLRGTFLPVTRITNKDIKRCDVLCMIRPNNAVFGRIANIVRAEGIKVLFFLDDDLLHLPNGIADMPWRKKGLMMSAQNSDIVVSSSPYICDYYSKAFNIKKKVVIDTIVPKEEIKEHLDVKNDRIKIVYAASLSHKMTFDHFIRPILKKIDKKYGDMISLTFMGVHPDLCADEYKMPMKFVGSLPLNKYRSRIEKENFDIGLAPLITSEFTKCKYFNKFIEYAMFGIVGIYSDTEPYTFVIENKENGILAGGGPDSWFDAISSAIVDTELVSRCRSNSYRTLKERFDSVTIMDKFIEEIPELVGEHYERRVKGYRISIYKFLYVVSRFSDWLYKAGYYFRHGGIGEVYKSIKRHVSVAGTVRS